MLVCREVGPCGAVPRNFANFPRWATSKKHVKMRQVANHTANWTHNSSYHVYPHLAIYFGSPFGRYLMFHTLTSVWRKKAYQYDQNMVPLFRAVVNLKMYLMSWKKSNITHWKVSFSIIKERLHVEIYWCI